MNKIFLATIFLISFNSFGQLGARLGYVRSNFSTFVNGNYKIDYSGRGGVGFNIFYSVKINNRLNFQPEFSYSQIGYSKVEFYYINSTHEVLPGKTISYYSFPLLFRYDFGSHIKPFINIGINPGVINKISKTPIGFIIGGGLKVPYKKHYFITDVRYNLGITNSYFGSKLNFFSLSVGYQF